MVVFANPLAEGFDGRQQRLQRGLQFWTQPLGFLGIQVARIAARNRSP